MKRSLIATLFVLMALSVPAQMLLKQSTAATLKLGPFVDDTDGKTAETGLTISQADVRLSKNGGDYAQKNDSNAATHDESGWYDVALNTTDTGTLGRLDVYVAESGALQVWAHYMVVPANTYDSLVAGSDTLTADVTQISGSNVSTSSAQIGVNLVNIAGSAVSTSSAQLGVNLVNIAGSAVSTSTAQLGVNAVQVAGGTPVTAASAADAVWDEARSGHTTAGSFGEGVASVVGSVGSVASGGITASSIAADAIGASELAADAATEIATAMFTANTGQTYSGANANSVVKQTADNAGGSALTVGDIADAVWDEAKAGHVTSNTMGAIMNSLTSTTIASSVWDAARSSYTTAGSFGQGAASVQGNVTGSVASVTGAVGSVTGNVGGNVTGSVGSVASGGITAASIAADAIGASELAADAATEIGAAVVGTAVEDAITLAQAMRLVVAFVTGKVTGGGTSTLYFRDQGDSLNRITMTVDANGNRTVSINVTD